MFSFSNRTSLIIKIIIIAAYPHREAEGWILNSLRGTGKLLPLDMWKKKISYKKSYLVGLVKRYHASYADSVTTRYWTATPTCTKTLSFVFVSHKTSSCCTRSERRPTTDCSGQIIQLGPSLTSLLNCPVIIVQREDQLHIRTKRSRFAEAYDFFSKKIELLPVNTHLNLQRHQLPSRECTEGRGIQSRVVHPCLFFTACLLACLLSFGRERT